MWYLFVCQNGFHSLEFSLGVLKPYRQGRKFVRGRMLKVPGYQSIPFPLLLFMCVSFCAGEFM